MGTVPSRGRAGQGRAGYKRRVSTNGSTAPASRRRATHRRLLIAAVTAAVAVAFADSSIVVLALPDVYGAFNTSIVGVSWVITAYNLVVALTAFALVPLVRRLDVGRVSRVGLLLFFAGSTGSAASWSLPALIAFRCLQGVGAAMLLAGAVALLSALTGSAARGVALWTAAGNVRRRARARARRRADRALQLARDLRLPGARGADRPRRRVRIAPAPARRAATGAAATPRTSRSVSSSARSSARSSSASCS